MSRSRQVPPKQYQPGLPDAPTGVDAAVAQWMQQVTTALKQGLGQTGRRDDSFITWRDMETGGLVVSDGAGGYLPVTPPEEPPDLSPPPELEGLSVSGGMTAIYVTWDDPELNYYYHIEVHRSASNELSTAVLVGTTIANIFENVVGSDKTTYFYWVRTAKQSGGETIIGPWNDTQGTPGKAADDPEWILDNLEGRIGETHLNESLNTEIGKIPGIELDIGDLETGLHSETIARQEEDTVLHGRIETNVSSIGDNAAAIVTESETRASEDAALASRITTLGSEVGDNAAAIVTESETRASEDAALATRVDTVQVELGETSGAVEVNAKAIAVNTGGIADIRTEYTVKLDVDGYVGGFGLVNDGEVISALWRVDVFGVGAPGCETLAFAIDNTVNPPIVAMDGASIVTASIKDAQIGDLSVDKLIGGTADFVHANIAEGSITNAQIGDVIQSNNYRPGQDGWIINKQGDAEFFNVIVRGIVDGSVIEGSLIDGTLFIDPETESVVVTEADTGNYPRYLTFLTDYLRTMAVAAYNGNEQSIGGGWVRSDVSPVMTCPIKAANYTGDGHSTNIYFNQNRFEKFRPLIVIQTWDIDSDLSKQWCTGPRGADDEPRHMREVRLFVTISTPNQPDVALTFSSVLNNQDCGSNDGHAWPKPPASFTQTVNGWELRFRYGSASDHEPWCHGYNQRYFTFRLAGHLPENFSGNGAVTATLYFEWRNQRGEQAYEKSLVRNLSMGGQTRS